MLNRMLVSRLRSRGIVGLSLAILRRVIAPRIRAYNLCRGLIEGKSGLEIGGPSPIFARRGLFPAYTVAGHIDNCNFSTHTLWERSLEEGSSFQFDKRRPRGSQYFLEATDLRGLASESYDFALSSHVLEHVANPLLALSEWIRVIKPDGILVLVVPHKEGSFDHRRPVTTLQHLLEDFDKGTTEADTTHLGEILELHDLSRDPEAGGIESFKQRAADNLQNRGLHHHVFDAELAVAVVHNSGLQILAVEVVRPFNIFVIARKLSKGEKPDNGAFAGKQAMYRQSSPFLADRIE